MKKRQLPGKPLKKSKSQLAKLIKKSPLGLRLSGRNCRKLATICQVRQLKRDEILILENADSGQLYHIVKGSLSVGKDLTPLLGQEADHSEYKLNILTEGNLAGVFGLLQNVPRTATLTTLEPTTVLAMDRKAFKKLAKKDPALGFKVLEAVIFVIRSILVQMNLFSLDMDEVRNETLTKGID